MCWEACLGQASAELMHEAKIEERLCIAVLRGRLVELRRTRPVALRAAPIPVAVAQLQQRINVALPHQLSAQLVIP